MAKDLEKRLDEVHNAYTEGQISRRDFVKFTGMAAAALGIAGSPLGLATNAFAGKKSITLHSWGGSTSEALRKFAFDPFTKASGIKVIDAAFTGMDAFLTQVKASYPPGGEFNVAHLSAVYDYARYTDLGFGVVLDESKIPNLKNVMTKMTDTLKGISGGLSLLSPMTWVRPVLPITLIRFPRKRLKSWVPPSSLTRA